MADTKPLKLSDDGHAARFQPTDVIPVEHGGTGATTNSGAVTNLLPTQTNQSGKVLSTNGTSISWVDPSPTGFTGSHGAVGYTGSQGIQGTTGYVGSQGIQGTTGYVGSQGIQGDTGFTGSQGTTGYVGSTGSVGFTGSIGATGYVGSTGTTGYVGSVGYVGSRGDIGYVGSRGTTGFTGSYGYTGSKGDTGLGFSIAKSYASVAALTADTAPTGITTGQFAIIETGNVNDAENSRLYLWNGATYAYTSDLSGAQGITGPIGYVGSQGTTGYVGSQGTTGYVGSASTVIGYTGSQGATGYVGSSQWVTSGSDIYYSTGNVAIGTSPVVGYGLRMGKAATGAVTTYNVTSETTVQSDVTNTNYGFLSYPSTQAAAFTLNNLFHYTAGQGTFGAGSTVTNQAGFFVNSSIIGATNNFGFWGNIPAGTNRYNLYMSGTAVNYLNGNLCIGNTVNNTEKLNLLDSGANAVNIRWDNSATTAGFYLGISTTGVASLFHGDAQPITFSTNALEVMRVSSGGRLLIGSTTDDGVNKLQVTGAAYVSGNVGIGASPSYPLHIQKAVVATPLWATIKNTDASVASDAGIRLETSTTNATCTLHQSTNGTTYYTNNFPTGALSFSLGGSAKMTMTHSGTTSLYPTSGNIALAMENATTAYMQYKSTGAGTDLKYWRTGANIGGSFFWETVNDAYTAANTRVAFTHDTDLINYGVTTSLIKSEGKNGYGAFYAGSSGTNNSYMFFGNAGGEKARITVTDSGQIDIAQGTAVNTRMHIDAAGDINFGSTPNAGAVRSAGVWNSSTAAGTAARLQLATGTTNSYVISQLKETGHSYELSLGEGVTDGMWINSSSAGVIRFRQGTTERMRIDSAGNVGIACTPIASTTSKMFVGGDITIAKQNAFVGANLYYSGGWKHVENGTGAAWIYGQTSAVAAVLYASDNNTSGAGAAATTHAVMEISNLGHTTYNYNVGIGQDPTNWYSNSYRFVATQNQNAVSRFGFGNNVVGASAVVQVRMIGGTGNSFIDTSLYDNNGAPSYTQYFGPAVTSCNISLGNASGIFTVATNSIERMRINATGDLLLNSTNAGGVREFKVVNAGTTVNTQARQTISTGSANAYVIGALTENGAGGSTYELALGAGVTGGMYFTSTASGPIVFRQGGTNRLEINGSGNVGIGAAPSTKLDVVNATAVDTYVRTRNSVSTAGFDVGIASTGDAWVMNRNNTNLIFGTNNTECFRFGAAGQFGVGSNANYGVSGQAIVSNGASTAPSWQHVSPPNIAYASGRYYGPTGVTSTAALTLAAANANGRMCMIPIVVAKTQLFSAISCYVNTLIAAKTIRLGIYSDSNGTPGSLLYDAGTASFATVGSKDITLNQTLPPGIYWLAFLTDSTATGLIRGVTIPANFPTDPMLGAVDTTGSGGIIWAYSTQAYGALPSTPSTVTYVTNSATIGPALYLKV